MAARPGMSEDNFLAHIFRPSKNPRPTGLRKTTLTSPTGKNRRRLAAYNRMDAVKQHLLNVTGTRGSYLAGTTTLADAKKQLRAKAIERGITKPPRQRATQQLPGIRSGDLRSAIQTHLRRTVIDAGKPYNAHTSNKAIASLANPSPEMLQWTHAQIRSAGRPGSPYESIDPDDGATSNPFWYH